MRSIPTLESQIVYAEGLADNIKSRQTIVSSKLALVETTGFSLSGSVADFTIRRMRIIFTPTSDNGYAELGIGMNATSLIMEIFSDPSYAQSATQQAWILTFTNVTFDPITVNISATVVAMTSGSLTGAWI